MRLPLFLNDLKQDSMNIYGRCCLDTAADPRYQTHKRNFNLRARGAACTLLSQVASSGGSGHDMVVM